MEWPGIPQLKPNYWDTLTPEQQRERADDFLKRLAKGGGRQPTGGGGGKPTGGGGGGKPTGGGGEPTGGGGPVTVMHVMDILAGLERTVERRESIRKMLPPTKALWTSETMMT